MTWHGNSMCAYACAGYVHNNKELFIYNNLKIANLKRGVGINSCHKKQGNKVAVYIIYLTVS